MKKSWGLFVARYQTIITVKQKNSKKRTLNNLVLLNCNPISRQERWLKAKVLPNPARLAWGLWNWSSDKSDFCIVILPSISSTSLFSAPQSDSRTISSHFVVQDLRIKSYKNTRPLLDSPEYKTNRPLIVAKVKRSWLRWARMLRTAANWRLGAESEVKWAEARKTDRPGSRLGWSAPGLCRSAFQNHCFTQRTKKWGENQSEVGKERLKLNYCEGEMGKVWRFHKLKKYLHSNDVKLLSDTQRFHQKSPQIQNIQCQCLQTLRPK